MATIIGRKQEQKELRRLYESDEAEMVVVYGRRRVGKTYLVNQTFAEDGFDFKVTGLYKKRMAAQLENFTLALREYAGDESLPMAKNWMVCFAAGVVLTAVLMAWIFSKITAEKAFKIFGVFYIGAIVLLNCVAVSNLITAPSTFTAICAAGAFLFLISDIVLILNTFGPESKFSLRITNLSL